MRCLRKVDPWEVEELALLALLEFVASTAVGAVELLLGRCNGNGREAMGRPEGVEDFPVTGSDLNGLTDLEDEEFRSEGAARVRFLVVRCNGSTVGKVGSISSSIVRIFVMYMSKM